MALAKIISGAVFGVDAYSVEIEVNAGGGEPKVVVVGLPDAAVKESTDRVWTALLNSGFYPHDGRTTVNLAPADIRKEGPSFDLPIALGMLAAKGDIDKESLEGVCVVGELALSGQVRRVRGVLPIALQARNQGCDMLLVPTENAEEAAVVGGIRVYGIDNLREVADFLIGERELEPVVVDAETAFGSDGHYDVDFADVKGQESAKRALEVAVSGGHNLLMLWSITFFRVFHIALRQIQNDVVDPGPHCPRFAYAQNPLVTS